MSTSKAAKIHTVRKMAPRCAAIPGLMRARQDLSGARTELSRVVGLAKDSGLVPRTEKDAHPDAMANLWFTRAAHEFVAAAGTLPDHHEKPPAEFFAATLLPLCKGIVQHFISQRGVDGVHMDDGGLLAGGVASADGLRVNALWYAALQVTADALQKAHDPAAGHFERLAGRFRRSFQKSYWCDEHKCICSPAARELPNHGSLPDADQLLLTVLPASPLPRTKQRQILLKFSSEALGILGVRIHHSVQGPVESPLHRVWLAQGILADDPGERAKAAAIVMPLATLRASAKKTELYTFYRDGQPVTAHQKPDPLASAEVLGALMQFLGE